MVILFLNDLSTHSNFTVLFILFFPRSNSKQKNPRLLRIWDFLFGAWR